MINLNATDVRKEWSKVIDTVVREKPLFFKRTRDRIMISNVEYIKTILQDFTFTAEKYNEDDGSISLSLHELDIVANGKNETSAKMELAKNLQEYAEEFYQDFAFWSKAPNRKTHVPYILKILLYQNLDEIVSEIICQPGKKY